MSGHRLHVLLAAFLVASTALAGCLNNDEGAGADADPTQSGADGTDGDGGSDGNSTAPVDTGDGMMNESLGHQPHLHDYWEGRERVTIMDDDVEVNPFNGLGMTFFQVFGRQNAGAGGAIVSLPDGSIVYEGTGKLEITVTWEDPLVSGMTMRYRSAASADYSEAMPVAAGAPIEVAVTPAMTDMPHDSASRWRFFFEPGSGQTVLAPFHLKVDVVKMHDIMEFPGHPELFEGKTEKILLDADGQSARKSFALQFADFITGADPNADAGLVPTDLVPMETVEMRIDVTVSSATSSIGEASEMYLLYKSAETNNYRWSPPVEGDVASGRFVFAIPVEMSMVDSPYAAESQWRFDVFANVVLVEGTGIDCGGCADQQVQYHMTVTAFDHNVILQGGESDDDDDDDDDDDRRAPSAAADADALPVDAAEIVG